MKLRTLKKTAAINMYCCDFYAKQQRRVDGEVPFAICCSQLILKIGPIKRYIEFIKMFGHQINNRLGQQIKTIQSTDVQTSSIIKEEN